MHAGINKWRRASDIAADRLSRMGMGGEGGMGGGGVAAEPGGGSGGSKSWEDADITLQRSDKGWEKRNEKRRGGLRLQVRTAE